MNQLEHSIKELMGESASIDSYYSMGSIFNKNDRDWVNEMKSIDINQWK